MQENGKWIVLDWNKKEDALKSGIIKEDRTYGGCRISVEAPKNLLKNIVFRNFEELFIENTRISECGFENCVRLNISECKVDDCTFDRTGFISADCTDFSDSHFCNSTCWTDPLISIENGNFSRCSFENIELHGRGYLIEAWGDVWVDYCDFKNIRSENEDGELFHCEETRGKIIKKKVEFQIVDEETCNGLKDVETI